MDVCVCITCPCHYILSISYSYLSFHTCPAPLIDDSSTTRLLQTNPVMLRAINLGHVLALWPLFRFLLLLCSFFLLSFSLSLTILALIYSSTHPLPLRYRKPPLIPIWQTRRTMLPQKQAQTRSPLQQKGWGTEPHDGMHALYCSPCFLSFFYSGLSIYRSIYPLFLPLSLLLSFFFLSFSLFLSFLYFLLPLAGMNLFCVNRFKTSTLLPFTYALTPPVLFPIWIAGLW